MRLGEKIACKLENIYKYFISCDLIWYCSERNHEVTVIAFACLGDEQSFFPRIVHIWNFALRTMRIAWHSPTQTISAWDERACAIVSHHAGQTGKKVSSFWRFMLPPLDFTGLSLKINRFAFLGAGCREFNRIRWRWRIVIKAKECRFWEIKIQNI